MKKFMLVTTTWYGGSGVKHASTKVKKITSQPGHSRPAFAMSGSHRCGGLPILRRTEKAYAAIEWRMRQEVCHV